MSGDIVERLISERDRHVAGYPGPRRDVAELLDRSIDHITTLTSERDKLETWFDGLTPTEMSAWQDRMIKRAEAAETSLAKVVLQVDSLKTALEPFAAAAGNIPETFADDAVVSMGIDYTLSMDEMIDMQDRSGSALKSDRATLVVSVDGVNAGHLRAASEVLRSLSNEGEQMASRPSPVALPSIPGSRADG